MIILEGIRRSGKTYTIEKIEQYFSDLKTYKDFGKDGRQ